KVFPLYYHCSVFSVQVGESLPRCHVDAQEEEVSEPSVINDPRSPTQGIVRTPLRPSLHDSLNLLAKQLSEVFVSEDSGIEGSPQANKEAETSDQQPVSEALPPPAEEPVICAPPEEPAPPSGPQPRQRGKSPHAPGAKNVRQRPRKALVSTAHGRSPLKILQEDNSPSTAMQKRQVIHPSDPAA
ncbi:hypothetical protein GDO81_029015, partial [Engystomops pustulosus]